jgi:hypothetical protein
LVVVSFGVMAAFAGAKIVVGRGIDRVWLNDTPSQVSLVLGKPDQANTYPQGTVWYFNKHGHALVVGFNHHHRVTGVYTGNRREKTNRGVGPGSSLASVRKAYPHIKCSAPGSTGLGPKAQICTLKSRFVHHRVVTSFSFQTPTKGYEVSIDLR